MIYINKNTWAFSDIHGNRLLFNEVMKCIGPEDIVYFLGDAIDRGPDGWNILKELLNDPRIIFIKGNHEDMMVKALHGYPDIDIYNEDFTIWGWNGNEPTLNAIFNDNPKTVKEILGKVKALPAFKEYINKNRERVWLSHAGCDYINDPKLLNEEDLIWDRSHYIGNYWHKEDPDDVIIVHGHTPIPILVDDINDYALHPEDRITAESGALWYAAGHKVCIDCGAHFTNQTVLLNLDTWDEEIFELSHNNMNK